MSFHIVFSIWPSGSDRMWHKEAISVFSFNVFHRDEKSKVYKAQLTFMHGDSFTTHS